MGQILKDCVNEEASRSTLVSRNITVMNRRTSVRLEPEMWVSLKEISQFENCSIHDICTLVCLCKKPNTSLTAAIRVFLMLYFRAAVTEDGHGRAGHGTFENMKKRARISEQDQVYFERTNLAAKKSNKWINETAQNDHASKAYGRTE